jgi:hypothetical protein
MSVAGLLERVQGLAGLAPSAALSEPRWWTSWQIAGLCVRAAQWVDALPRDDRAEPFVRIPVQSRSTPLDITADTVHEILDRACAIFHEWLEELPAAASAVASRDLAWEMLYALDGEAVETCPRVLPAAPEFVPGGSMAAWLGSWAR